MPKKINEPTKILYLRLPTSWHDDLQRIAIENGNDVVSLLRPYIRLALLDIKNKYKRGEA